MGKGLLLPARKASIEVVGTGRTMSQNLKYWRSLPNQKFGLFHRYLWSRSGKNLCFGSFNHDELRSSSLWMGDTVQEA